MENLHLKSTTSVIIDGKTQIVPNLSRMFEVLNIPNTEEYHEACVGIVQKLIVFGEVDLSPAYPGHTVVVTNKFECE